jgi:hypothetical protein
VTELNPWYITGFCDGEAAFTYSRNGGSFALYFGITQREDNAHVIEDIWEYFNYVGKIYRRKEAPPTKNSGFTNPSVYYRTTKIDELTIIIDHFDKYPLHSKKKRESYIIWREMVMHKLKNYRTADYDKLRDLAEKLSNSNSKSRAFKVHSR